MLTDLINKRLTKEELIEELKNRYVFIDITEAEEYIDGEDYRLDFETVRVNGSIWYAKTRNDRLVILEIIETTGDVGNTTKVEEV